MENPIKMDDLGVPPFKETPILKCKAGFFSRKSGRGLFSWPNFGGANFLSQWLRCRVLHPPHHEEG